MPNDEQAEIQALRELCERLKREIEKLKAGLSPNDLPPGHNVWDDAETGV